VPAGVPEAAATVLRTARELLRQSYYCYEFSTVAVMHSLIAVEIVLRDRIPEAGKKPLHDLVEQGAADGILTARQAACLDHGRRIRNGVAHGQTTHAVQTLDRPRAEQASPGRPTIPHEDNRSVSQSKSQTSRRCHGQSSRSVEDAEGGVGPAVDAGRHLVAPGLHRLVAAHRAASSAVGCGPTVTPVDRVGVALVPARAAGAIAPAAGASHRGCAAPPRVVLPPRSSCRARAAVACWTTTRQAKWSIWSRDGSSFTGSVLGVRHTGGDARPGG
jgi:hypothetical protein